MTDQIERLKQLQAVDAELWRLRRAKEHKPLELARAQAAIAEQEAAAQQQADRMKAAQLKQKDREGELATHEGAIKKLQGQLFQVKTNKEYTAMQHEIDQHKADASLVEELILGLLDEVE